MFIIIAFLFAKSKLIGISYSLVYISMSLSLAVTYFNCVFYTGTVIIIIIIIIIYILNYAYPSENSISVLFCSTELDL